MGYFDFSFELVITSFWFPHYLTDSIKSLLWVHFISLWESNFYFFSKLSRVKICKMLGFPGGAVVENPPANAGNTGSSPGLGRSHMLRSSWAREPQLLSLRVWSLCSATREATIVRGPRTAMKSGPRSPQLEKALAQKRRPNTAKNKIKKKKKICKMLWTVPGSQYRLSKC